MEINVYHQDPTGQSNAKWELLPLNGSDLGYYHIRDTKHSKCIVAGDTYDGNLYHQDPNNRLNAKWRLVPFSDAYGSETYYLQDKKHNRAIVAGNVADNRVYHQYPQSRPNARWAIVPNYL